jgi:hypothetical protein
VASGDGWIGVAGYRLVQEAIDAAEAATEMLAEIGGDKLQRALTAGHALNSIRHLPTGRAPVPIWCRVCRMRARLDVGACFGIPEAGGCALVGSPSPTRSHTLTNSRID